MEFASRGRSGSETRRRGWGPSLRLGRRDACLVAAASLLLVPTLLVLSGVVPLPGFVERGIGELIPGAGPDAPSTGRASLVAGTTSSPAPRPGRSSAGGPGVGSVLRSEPEVRGRTAPARPEHAASHSGDPAAGGSGSGGGSQEEGGGSNRGAGAGDVSNEAETLILTANVPTSGSGPVGAATAGVGLASSASPSGGATVSGDLALTGDTSADLDDRASADVSAGEVGASTSGSVGAEPVGLAVDFGKDAASVTAVLPAAGPATTSGAPAGLP